MKYNKLINQYNKDSIINIPLIKSFTKPSVNHNDDHKLYSIIDDTIDISPTNNGSIYKKVLRKGNKIKGYPFNKDNVEILWRIYDIDRNPIHDLYNFTSSSSSSTTDEIDKELFNFQLGAEPREVILGWEIGKQMQL